MLLTYISVQNVQTCLQEHFPSSAVAAGGFGATVRIAARLKIWVGSSGYLALAKHHVSFKLRLDFVYLLQHGLDVRSVFEWKGVAFRGVSLQVKNERGVMGLQVCGCWAVLIWGGSAVDGT